MPDSSGSPKPGPIPGPKHQSFELGASFMPVPTSLSLNPDEMQVLAWLRAFKPNIVDAERTFVVDRRAIAGAIAWEMLENPRGRGVRAVGAGKVHLFNYSLSAAIIGGVVGGAQDYDTVAKQTEDYGYLPKQSLENRRALLATPAGAIKYIAAIMAAVADIAGRYGFEDIRTNPEILTNVYHGSDLKKWEEHLRGKAKGSPFKGGNPMDIWVVKNTRFLEEAVGTTDLSVSQAPVTCETDGADMTVTAVRGSTLSAIAETKYGTWELWPLIYDLNKIEIGPNPNKVRIGLRLSVRPLWRYSAIQIADAKRRAATWRSYR